MSYSKNNTLTYETATCIANDRGMFIAALQGYFLDIVDNGDSVFAKLIEECVEDWANWVDDWTLLRIINPDGYGNNTTIELEFRFTIKKHLGSW